MKQTFIFTSDNSFTHIKDKMHQSVAEHIVQNDQTKELYHYVVSYGSSFNISHSSIFMSHLLKMIGLTGFAVAYSADNSNIVLPYYPYKMPENKSLVEVPKNISLNEINFEPIKLLLISFK